MNTGMRMVFGLAGILLFGTIGLPALWQQADVSPAGGPSEVLASGDEEKEAIQEHLDLATQYDKDAQHHEAEAKRYEAKASAITQLMDTKGFRRDGMKMAAESHSSMASELRFRARVHRMEAELLREKSRGAGQAK
ncbi:MAG: hypothetical protein GDA68_16685 [Nitrospira sp. CR2.1]|nr:hypothetical protein [Nitrospira sp. CR2.1]